MRSRFSLLQGSGQGKQEMRLQDLQTPQNQQRTEVPSDGQSRQCTSFTCSSDSVTAQDARCSDQLKKVKGKSVQKQHSLSSSASTITKGSKATRGTTSPEGQGQWHMLNHTQAPGNQLKLFREAKFWRLVLKCQALTFPFFFPFYLIQPSLFGL